MQLRPPRKGRGAAAFFSRQEGWASSSSGCSWWVPSVHASSPRARQREWRAPLGYCHLHGQTMRMHFCRPQKGNSASSGSSPGVQRLHLCIFIAVVWVQSWVGELRSCKPCAQHEQQRKKKGKKV